MYTIKVFSFSIFRSIKATSGEYWLAWNVSRVLHCSLWKVTKCSPSKRYPQSFNCHLKEFHSVSLKRKHLLYGYLVRIHKTLYILHAIQYPYQISLLCYQQCFTSYHLLPPLSSLTISKTYDTFSSLKVHHGKSGFYIKGIQNVWNPPFDAQTKLNIKNFYFFLHRKCFSWVLFFIHLI